MAKDNMLAPESYLNAKTVLVVAPREETRQSLEPLQREGFVLLSVPTCAEGAALLIMTDVNICIVDGSTANLGALMAATAAAGRSSNSDCGPSRDPAIMFLISDLATFDWQAYAEADRAEIVPTLTAPDELADRVRERATRLEHEQTAFAAAEKLRQGVRQISAAVRSTNVPDQIVETVVNGLVDVFPLSRVGVVTFADDRVPRLSAHWQSECAETPLDPVLCESRLREFANVLWSRGGAFRSEDGQSSRLAGVAGVGTEAADGNTRHWTAVPLGDGETPFGLFWLVRDKAAEAWSEMEVSLLQHLAGNVAYGLMQGQLITAQQEVVRRLQQLDQAKSAFLANVNHELRTPLTSLTAYLDLVQQGLGGHLPVKASEMLQIAERSAKRLGTLIEDVLIISRITADEPEMNWAPVNLTSLSSRVLGALRPATAAAGIELMVAVPAGLVIDGDAAQLERVVRYLTDNAVKFTPPGGRIEVHIAERVSPGEAPMVEVRITDTGVGIPEDEMSEIFTSFFQGSNARDAAMAGRGLGLAIVQGLVKGHHGTVEITSAVGGGTQALVSLPMRHGPSPVPESVQPVPVVGAGRG